MQDKLSNVVTSDFWAGEEMVAFLKLTLSQKIAYLGEKIEFLNQAYKYMADQFTKECVNGTN